MPTQRAHGGAALVPINLTAPGFMGLNTEAEATLLSPEWSTVLTNAKFDSAGRAAVRNGWQSQTATPASGVVMRVFEYVKADGTSETICSTDADIFSTAGAPTSIEGSLGITEGNIKFVNFNDKCIALGTGTSSNPSVYTGAGNFTTITVNSGTAPTSGVGTSAFGRLWCVDQDGKTIRYSALLDETRWDAADGGGLFDMSKVWPAGQDTVVAIEEFAGDLIIFGYNNTVIVTDGQGSSLGIDPTVMYVSDTIPGIGCVSQFAVCRAAGDLWFLSPTGVQTLNRALQDKTTPTNNVSRNIHSLVSGYLTQETDDDDITLMYSPKEDMVLLVFPQSNKAIYFDTRGQMQDGTYRSAEWSTGLQTAHYFTTDRQTYGSLTGTVGEIMKYAGYDEDGSSYDFAYSSGWLDFGREMNQYLKFVKRLTSFVFVDSATQINYSLYYDFNTNPRTTSVAAEGSSGAMFSVSEFTDSGTGIGYADPYASVLVESEFGGGVSLQELTIPGKGGGQYIKVGCNLSTASADFALQQINLYAKVGRTA